MAKCKHENKAAGPDKPEGEIEGVETEVCMACGYWRETPAERPNVWRHPRDLLFAIARRIEHEEKTGRKFVGFVSSEEACECETGHFLDCPVHGNVDLDVEPGEE